jgi:hypothetical protein
MQFRSRGCSRMLTPLQIENTIAHTLEDLLQHPYSGTEEVDASRFCEHPATSC